MAKKYFWLKLQNDFFNQKEIKMLRKLAGGDTFTIIYLKILLLSLKEDGRVYYDGVAKNMVEEIALEIDEEIENVTLTFNYLQTKGLLVFNAEDEVELSNIHAMIGSESASASRVRKHRENKALQCNTEVTDVKHLSNTEIEIEKELDIELEKEKEKKKTSCPKYSDEHFRLATLLKSNLENDFSKEMAKVKIEKWADDVRLIEERDKRTIEQIEFILNWLPTNEFWFGNIRSPKKLRDQFDKLAFEIKKEREQSARPKSNYGKPIKQEVIPAWSKERVSEKAEEEIKLDSEVEAKFKNYLERKERLQREKNDNA